MSHLNRRIYIGIQLQPFIPASLIPLIIKYTTTPSKPKNNINNKCWGSWNFHENKKKLVEMKNILIKVRKQMIQLEKKHPAVRNKYLEKYSMRF